jgi:ABC-2 type transport system permease protein/sodium transport system permease protein
MSRSVRMVRLIRKELNEILRDRRTIVTLLLMPLLLYPLLGLAFSQIFASGSEVLQSPVYRLGFASLPEAQAFMARLGRGEARLMEAGQLVDRSGNKTARLETLPVEQDLLAKLVALEMDGPPVTTLQNGSADLAVRPAPAKEEARTREWELFYREDSPTSREAFRYVRRLTEAADQGRLRPDALTLTPKPVAPEKVRQTSFLSALVPLVLILMTITGAVYPAIDLTAGERERGTMEMLAAAPIRRGYLLFAKYVAVLTVALLTALVNLLPMVLVLTLTGLARETFGTMTLAKVVVTLLLILALLVLFAAFFSAVLLALTSVARSFKEAQAYLIPLLLVALGPGLVSLLPGIQLDLWTAFVPLLNIVLLARDLLEGSATWPMGGLVVGMTAVYTVLALALAARIFGRETLFQPRRPGKQGQEAEEIAVLP